MTSLSITMINSLSPHRHPSAMVKVSTRPSGGTSGTSTRKGSSPTRKEDGAKAGSSRKQDVLSPYCPPLRAITRTCRRTSGLDGPLLPHGRLRGEQPGRLPVDLLHHGGECNRERLNQGQRRGMAPGGRGSCRIQAALAANTGNHPR